MTRSDQSNRPSSDVCSATYGAYRAILFLQIPAIRSSYLSAVAVVSVPFREDIMAPGSDTAHACRSGPYAGVYIASSIFLFEHSYSAWCFSLCCFRLVDHLMIGSYGNITELPGILSIVDRDLVTHPGRTIVITTIIEVY